MTFEPSDAELKEFLRLQAEADEQMEKFQKSLETASAPNVREAISANAYCYADYSYKVIMERIKEFETGLDDEHEVAVKLASFGQAITMSVSDIGYSNPSTLIF